MDLEPLNPIIEKICYPQQEKKKPTNDIGSSFSCKKEEPEEKEEGQPQLLLVAVLELDRRGGSPRHCLRANDVSRPAPVPSYGVPRPMHCSASRISDACTARRSDGVTGFLMFRFRVSLPAVDISSAISLFLTSYIVNTHKINHIFLASIYHFPIPSLRSTCRTKL